ncbi:putative bifunctional diguanylate cyclase/phosphodiesterase [Methylocella sp.]|uniref:putative bifunctional diguanylate cyclase/phosphodiesterase n=1 Tax=Methylocella sp. TaxID=1978226 RepID=UPI0037849612
MIKRKGIRARAPAAQPRPEPDFPRPAEEPRGAEAAPAPAPRLVAGGRGPGVNTSHDLAPSANAGGVAAAAAPAGVARRGSAKPEFELARLAWRAAVAPPARLPGRDAIALFRSGRFAEASALARPGAASLDILSAGPLAAAALGGASRLPLSDANSFVRTIDETCRRALAAERPAEATAPFVAGGAVGGYDLLALPLANPAGPPLCLLYMAERGEKYALAEALLGATEAGLAALAAIEGADGRPVDFEIAAANHAAARLLRRGPTELQGRRLSEFHALPGWREAAARLLKLAEAGGAEKFEAAGANGRLSVCAYASGGLVVVTLAPAADPEELSSFRLLFEESPTPTALCEPGALAFVTLNAAAAALWGYASADELAGKSLYDLVAPEDFARLECFAARPPAEAPHDVFRHRRADGGAIDVATHRRAILFRGRIAHLVSLTDVTERRRADARLAHMQLHDALTDLPNRALFREKLGEALSRLDAAGGRIALFYLDLDHFKNVNEAYGHPVGDALLRAVAERLRARLRPSDALARFGGDEFALMRHVAGPEEAAALAALVSDTVGRPFAIDGQAIEIATSIGVAMAPEDGREPDLMLKNADLALYRAKEDGRRATRFFEPGMDARARARRQIEIDLRRGLAAGEFELYYQPLVALKSGAVTGFEALMRWRHPERGMVPPTEFIGIAEEIGLIVPLGEWALRQACAEAASWPGALKVAVNLSPVQFRSGNLVHAVLTALAASGLPASRLELEITESILLAESEANLATLHSLRALGVSVSMDDFGTGYSSLSYLRAFPFDKIKIDRSFVKDLGLSDGSTAIVRAVAGLGVSLGVSTTAEGVETGEQLAFLRAEGCTEMQGYYFSPPIPASKIRPLLEANAKADQRFAPPLKH